jgi:hypothetical protein
MWAFSGYNEIQERRRKNVLIDYKKLQRLLGAGSYDQLRDGHRKWVEQYLGGGEKVRKEEWTGSIAVGSKSFVEKAKAQLGFRAKGREIIEAGEGYQVREKLSRYNPHFGAEKADIIPENTYLWNVKLK